MALQSKTDIFIGGREITAFKNILLHQKIGEHHTMELVCRMDVLEDLSQALGESSKNFLGETITMQTASIDSYSGYQALEFKGIVTEVKTIKGHEASSGDGVVIKAQSPTFITEDGPHYASYNAVTLSDIVTQTFKDYDKSKLEVLIQPNNSSTLHYSVQHNESAYAYISRLAAQYGEWLYYNGVKLIFGKPETTELRLTYGFDLKEYHLNLIPKSHNYKYYATDYLLDETHEKDTKEINATANGYSGFVSNKANTIYNKQTKVWHNFYNDPKSKQRLDSNVKLQKKATQIQQVIFSGVSDNPGVKLGNIVKVEGSTYRVISVTHTNTENGDYQNNFEAVTAEFDIYPNTNINAFPKSESQTAIVMENADPEGLGRIRVQFPWQKTMGEMTPWIRIVTPHAGSDKGFHFIPEVNEEVLIGFEGGNAEHPYMMGSLYNGSGKANAFKSEKNDVKAIKTRSGHTFELNDANGSESITITDKNGNIITIDTANNNITISALENMSLNAKNMQINVEENLDVTVGKNKTESINENSFIMANNEEKQVGEEIKVISATYKQEAQEITTDASGEIKTNAGGKISIASAETVEYGE
ncbi:type VI secretion system Vgr family protein [Bizionia paragorgiae]|uniref:Uncharacterized conserved protein, implicated in type VI secretion and phage assembly n=1 Tax=Bizionia paragorgiae TaxID=283786 RepID=A0A1H4CE88_BIZPA|nr:phage baseplate assembly protein V [Bizionia paragorgiae]SEA58717.1 Uncharacterized conserved protein, implicated in type VI secretion and phage assembly [Bizionia paragorgiae]